MSRTVFTHNLARSSSPSQLLRQYLLPLLRLWFCSAVQLGIALWLRELDKPPWYRGDGARFSIHRIHYTWKEFKDFELFKKPVRRIAKPPLTIFLCNPFLAKALLLEKSFSVCLTRIWTPRHSLKGLWPPPYRISHLRQWCSSVDKICRNWPIRGYTRFWDTRNDLC